MYISAPYSNRLILFGVLQITTHCIEKKLFPAVLEPSSYEELIEKGMMIACAASAVTIFIVGILACRMYRRIMEDQKYYDSVTEAGLNLCG